MLRKFAGSSFAAALLTLMVMKNVVFGFCLCQDQFILDRDTCCAEMAAEPVCGCENGDTPAVPCKDCVIDLQLEVGDFHWSADEFSPADQIATFLPPFFIEQTSVFPPLVTLRLDPPVRGSPLGSPPLYLRQSVLRL